MAVLRLFAAAREAAGTASEDVPGATVDEVLAAARARHGDAFARVLESSRVWCNGTPAEGGQAVGPDDEVAVLPPVSGGAEPSSARGRQVSRDRPAAGPGDRARAHPRRHRRVRRAGPPPAPEAASPAPADAGAPDERGEAADRLTRLRSVPLPPTGQVRVRGRDRPVSGTGARRTVVGRRYAVVYDTSGHKVTLGVLWFVAVVGSLALGWAPLALLFGIAAGWAALEAAMRSREAGRAAEPWVAALGGGAIGAAGAAGSEYVGGAILLVVVAAAVAAALTLPRRDEVLAAAGTSVLCAVPFGLASACVVLTRDLEIGAAVVLVLFASAYEAGDFLIGSGASNSVEGPLVGILTIAVTGAIVAVLQVPPFDGAPAFTFAALAAVACPLGQLACSAILPAADARAPSARRVDSLLLLAPAWAFTCGLLVASQG
ncbi:MoaD/ThiS family protein [Iamia majanohamensis]|uniref:MoaD/ThiS family protein n=1 Tax=Iamia majanohamensis TaxID=467976 RepID=A0AAE9YDG1_9ACTN|nr:MoaD/ThiS family protein [Iamia majanohamensis]WCO66767.1 MoaD/ThiS family protein [Iamia majanohamensis]